MTYLLLRLLCSVQGTTLLAVLDALGIECTTHDVVTHARQILDTAAAHEHDGVLLQVVAFARNIGGDFDAGAQTNTSDLTQCRVRLLRGGGVNTRAHAATQRAALESQSLGLLRLCLASLADKLFNSRQLDSPIQFVMFFFVEPRLCDPLLRIGLASQRSPAR
ncbi:hypothetical protein BIFLAC_04596 [Bifidobacterium animalis subsp. lactis HN019]|nr:hypothetical protein BIFLAC_04596 [Bifidobacterium animalis subsp. lactis HN019]